jgi:hypothetical protein
MKKLQGNYLILKIKNPANTGFYLLKIMFKTNLNV